MYKLIKLGSFKFGNNYCTKTKGKNSLYSHTVLLPKTKFPLRLEGKKLVDRDNLINKTASFTELYKWQSDNLEGKEFILHDGPPYANGETHMGHAINKILKDVIVRTNILEKRKVNYIPGWDCHGLPIELKAVSNSKNLSPIQIRERARQFATDTMEKQKRSFLSWGVCGDWENSYKTYNKDYVKNQIRQFYKLYEKKLVYRDIKPVYWSPSTRTALAEAELEYNNNHASTAIVIKLELNSLPDIINTHKKISALVWTTTPWTLPGNQAVCYNPKLLYSIVENILSSEHYIVCTNLVDDLAKKLQCELKIVKTFEGTALNGATYYHPIYRHKQLMFLPASHAIDTKGTGLVHTAPAHGPDDFLVALNNSMQIECMVDEDGKYTETAGPLLTGKYVLSDGLTSVLQIVEKDIVHLDKFVHSYPYDWRTKQPVILRASKQWFIDTNSIKQQAVEALDGVQILPKANSEIHKQHFKTQLLKRPYWCISRQRSWGVPIPVFYDTESHNVIIERDMIENYCTLIDKHGSNFWWSLSTEELLSKNILDQHDMKTIQKGADILDIWFDSGISWSSVLPQDKLADIYLEGVDQFTGWFQSSLLTSIALREKSPYKVIYVHGFAVDENGLKMSKSLGNVINPQQILEGCKAHKAYGIDTLRWWVACHANQDTITEVSSNVLQASNDEVQKVRSVLRFALAALTDYSGEVIQYESLNLIDKYMLHILVQYDKQVTEYLKDYQFNKIGISLLYLLTNSVSAIYYTAVKDRLYCEPQDSVNRRSTQFVLNNLLFITLRSIAPILPHLAEELYMHLPHKEAKYFFHTNKPLIDLNWESSNVENIVNLILELKRELNKIAGANTLNKKVVIGLPKESPLLQCHLKNSDLLDILQVAEAVIRDDVLETSLNISETKLFCCPRCRTFASNNLDSLCERCDNAVQQLDNKVQSIA